MKPSHLLFALGFVGSSGAILSFSGCQSLAGIEERSLDRHAVLCQEYCSTVMSNCTGENAVYNSESQCLDICSVFQPGNPNEPIGNTVACRLNRAQAATLEPAVQCHQAGPGGGGGPCGSDCEAWCTLLETACSTQYQQVAHDCVNLCESALIDRKSFHLERDFHGNTVQCRLVHSMVALEDPRAHCPHAAFIPTALCVAEQPSCEDLCHTTQGLCQGELAVWEDEAQCRATCALFELGANNDDAGPSVGCRVYHAHTAAVDHALAALHCSHAGPTGEGVCVAQSGDNCENYCLILEAACSAHDDWAGREQCVASCGVELADKGASARNPGYAVTRALRGDTLYCRVRHAILALEDAAECAAAFGGGACQ